MTGNGKLVLGHRMLLAQFGLDLLGLDSWQSTSEPIMISSAIEVDKLLQEFSVENRMYDLVVFEFTREQEEQVLMQRLKGY